MNVDRRLRWERCYNVRDVGGYPLAGGGETSWRAVVRADTLCRLTSEGRAALVDYGVRTVIDLRSGQELEEAAHPFAAHANGVRYVSLPLLHEEARVALRGSSSSEESYRIMIEACRPAFTRALSAVARAEPGAVTIHCQAGKDRTGLVLAMLLRLVGVPEDVVVDDYVLNDVGLQPLYEEWIGEAGDARERERRVRESVSKPEAMLRTLDHVNRRYGGVEAYLVDGGLPPNDVERVRARLLD